MRQGRDTLWALGRQNLSANVPTAGEFIREFTECFDARAYDDGYGDYEKDRMW